ncbi:hypothetical protein [Pseudarthrobacter sp. IC2-21]|uniref:hypothetical protein n=1 Tax=Pseudarthrobacter sp. IC2-21 TaxID=3092262 RepID=UPI002A6A74E9|nr:hypothetical protein [Pseudarthrobacter sp. IC2-21]
MMANTSSLLDTVDEMLHDAGETDPALRAALVSFGALGSLPVPEPRPDLAALLSAQTTLLVRHRLRRRHRTAAVGLAVIAGMGLGVSGVAATVSTPKVHASASIQQMLQDWAPEWTIAGTLAAGGPADSQTGTAAQESGAGDAAPAGPGQPDSEPAERSVAGQEQSGSDAETSAEAETANSGRGDKHDAADRGTDNPAADAEAVRTPAGDSASPKAPRTNGAGPAQNQTRPAEAPGVPGGTPADGLAGTGKLMTNAPSDTAKAAVRAPARKEKTGAGDAGPGSIWLKKFNH